MAVTIFILAIVAAAAMVVKFFKRQSESDLIDIDFDAYVERLASVQSGNGEEEYDPCESAIVEK